MASRPAIDTREKFPASIKVPALSTMGSSGLWRNPRKVTWPDACDTKSMVWS